MREKERAILKFLSSQDGWVTSFSMSALLGISVRTVKSHIGDINGTWPGLVQSSRKGFLVADKARLMEIFKEAQTDSGRPQTAEDRRKYIFCKLLLEQEHCDLDLLASELSISHTTLINELARLKGELFGYDLALKTKNNQICLAGPEGNKKKLLSALIYEDAKVSFLSTRLIQSYLPHFDLTGLRMIVTETLRAHHYFMDEFSLLNLVMHIAIAMERHRLRQLMPNGEGSMNWPLIGVRVRSIIGAIAARVGEQFAVRLTEREQYDFALLVMTRVIQDRTNEIKPEELNEIVGGRVTALIALMQRRAKDLFNITLTNPDFTVRFSLHVKNMLIRLEHNIHLRNPQMTEIKNSYPFIYDVSVYLAGVITEETGYAVNEDEISYIALHLGVLIEERKAIKHEARAVLLNPQYFYNASDLAERCAQIFSHNLHIAGMIADEDELAAYADYDLILTTVPLLGFHDKPSVQISSRLDARDIPAVALKIEEVLKVRIKTKVEARLRFMFREELFFAGREFRDRDDVICTMADKLIAEGYADPSFKQKLFEREQVSSSAYSNIAMPHPLEMCALTSVIGVSLHPGGILWNGIRVNIVFLLAINIRDRLFFKDIFDFVTEVVSDEENLKTLLAAKTYDEFMERLVSFAK